jgi:branched-chain amino acid transport system ATP-binding protein
MLKLARALLGRPKLLLLDEPSEGLAPLIVGQLREWLATLKSEGLDMLISEQNTGFALALADRAYIIEKGQIRHTAAAKDLLESDEIRRHLGV